MFIINLITQKVQPPQGKLWSIFPTHSETHSSNKFAIFLIGLDLQMERRETVIEKNNSRVCFSRLYNLPNLPTDNINKQRLSNATRLWNQFVMRSNTKSSNRTGGNEKHKKNIVSNLKSSCREPNLRVQNYEKRQVLVVQNQSIFNFWVETNVKFANQRINGFDVLK